MEPEGRGTKLAIGVLLAGTAAGAIYYAMQTPSESPGEIPAEETEPEPETETPDPPKVDDGLTAAGIGGLVAAGVATVVDALVKPADGKPKPKPDQVRFKRATLHLQNTVFRQSKAARQSINKIVKNILRGYIAALRRIASASGKLRKLGQLAKATPWGLIAQTLVQPISFLLQNDPGNYLPCGPDQIDVDAVLSTKENFGWRFVIEMVPILGDVFTIVSPMICFEGGCPDGYENVAGLCYKKCNEIARELGKRGPDEDERPQVESRGGPGGSGKATLNPSGSSIREANASDAADWFSDGALYCYKRYPGFDNPQGPVVGVAGSNGMLHTTTHVTKSIVLDTGKPIHACPASHPDRIGALCYENVPSGWRDVGGTLWEDCKADETDGGVFCARYVPAGTPVQLEACPPGWTNDGLICREPITCDTWWNPLSCRGGALRGRLDGGGVCSENKQKIDGLCYERCPPGTQHTPGMPYECSRRGKASRVRAVVPLQCGENEQQIGALCYPELKPLNPLLSDHVRAHWPFQRQTEGLLSQGCPDGALDIGVGCQRERFQRPAGFPAFRVVAKQRDGHEVYEHIPSGIRFSDQAFFNEWADTFRIDRSPSLIRLVYKTDYSGTDANLWRSFAIQGAIAYVSSSPLLGLAANLSSPYIDKYVLNKYAKV